MSVHVVTPDRVRRQELKTVVVTLRLAHRVKKLYRQLVACTSSTLLHSLYN